MENYLVEMMWVGAGKSAGATSAMMIVQFLTSFVCWSGKCIYTAHSETKHQLIKAANTCVFLQNHLKRQVKSHERVQAGCFWADVIPDVWRHLELIIKPSDVNRGETPASESFAQSQSDISEPLRCLSFLKSGVCQRRGHFPGFIAQATCWPRKVLQFATK